MKSEYLSYLCCPICRADLFLEQEVTNNDSIQEGELICRNCDSSYPITNHIPRFVESQGYASSFGSQWNAFAASQLDGTQVRESALRFDSEVGWTDRDLSKKTILEIGSGAGRFIDVVSKRGVKLAIGVDVTSAVDASQANMGSRENVLFIQADAFNLPIKDSVFDFAYSIGVLHHSL